LWLLNCDLNFLEFQVEFREKREREEEEKKAEKAGNTIL
jgi:hypothetical protein